MDNWRRIGIGDIIGSNSSSRSFSNETSHEGFDNNDKLAPKTIVLIFGGVDLFSTETDVSSTLITLNNEIIEYGNKNNKRIYTNRYNTRMNGNVIGDAYNYVKDNYMPGDRVIIYGFSMGGVAGNSTANFLAGEKFSVELLITVDAAWGWRGEPIQVSSNVKVNVNHYQTTTQLPIGSRGYPSKPQKGNKSTKIENYNWDGRVKGLGNDAHGRMDESTYGEVFNRIKSVIM